MPRSQYRGRLVPQEKFEEQQATEAEQRIADFAERAGLLDHAVRPSSGLDDQFRRSYYGDAEEPWHD